MPLYELERGGPIMTSNSKVFEEFARDCVRLAEQADTPELREQTSQLGARVDAGR